MPHEFKVVNMEREDAAVVRFQCAPGQAGPHLGEAYGEIGGYLHELGLDHDDTKVFGRFLTLAPVQDVEAGFTVSRPIAPKGRVQPGVIPAGEAAMTTYVGPYSGLPAAGQALMAWIRETGREPGGPPLEVYVSDPAEVPEAEIRTDVYIPLKPR
ncbi:MAG TPA: GyrI-like domain-containing protein [Dehalococcoidia bacterium]